MLSARDAVLRLKEYHPPLGGRRGMRLDFNENTSGCSPRVLAKLRAMDGETLSRYPEREPVEAAVAEFLRLEPPQILLTNGVDEAIHLLCETYLEPGDEVLIAVPTFSMYEVYALATGAKVTTIPYEPDFHYPTEALLRSISPRTRMIAIANPNNPTGTVVDEVSLLRIAAAAPNAALLVDEAYTEFYGKTVMPRIAKFANLFVARTFSKAYGMAGLRIGVLAGNTEQMRMVRRVSSPYSVNQAALACLPDALADEQYIQDYVAQVLRGRARLSGELRALGVPHWPSEANFILTRIGDKRIAFVQAMRRRGILVRDRNSDPGCAGCVRITVGTDEQTDKLLAALRNVLEEIGWAATCATEA
ncbi:MAG: histidinol-phosphate transaminase [Terriglobales bacterium]